MSTSVTILDAALLLSAGCIAGIMNAIAGGGSFISFPALVLAGLPSVGANVSSTVALVPGTLASAYAYTSGRYRLPFRDVGNVRLPLVLAASVAGGLVGAVLLLSTPVATFDVVIPWLLLLATFTFAYGPRVGGWLRRRTRIGAAMFLPVQFLLGVYGGYFGGAVGIMMMAFWSLVDGADLKTLNPTRTIVVAATNAIAVAWFVVGNEVRWPQTLLMLAGAVGGGYVGARIGQRLPAAIVRGAVIATTIAMTVIFFRRAYR